MVLGRLLSAAVGALCLLLVQAPSAADARAESAARPWLGLMLQKVDDHKASALGRPPGEELVGFVEAGSPASRAGIQPGDLVIAVDGQPVNAQHTTVEYVQRSLAGLTLSVTVIRQGQAVTLPVTLGVRPAGETLVDNNDVAASGPRPADSARPLVAGATLVSLTPAIAEPLGMGRDAAGAAVLSVEPGSRADHAGLRKGDVLLVIGGARTLSAPAAAEALAAGIGERPTLLLIGRGASRGFLVLPATPLRMREKWGPLWQLVDVRFADEAGKEISEYSWTERGRVLGLFRYRVGETVGTTYVHTLQPDGRILVTGADDLELRVSGDTALEVAGRGRPQRWTYEETDGAIRVTRVEVKRDGTLKPVGTSVLPPIETGAEAVRR